MDFAEAKTNYGITGIKVWVYKGEAWTAAISRRPQSRKSAARNQGVKHAAAS